MIHRAIFGSLERFTGILIEHHAGKFPLWLAPLQVVVATITGDADDYARAVLARLKAAGIRAELDLRNEKINYKVREHSLAKVPLILVVGRQEAENQSVALRTLGGANQEILALEDAVVKIAAGSTPPLALVVSAVQISLGEFHTPSTDDCAQGPGWSAREYRDRCPLHPAD